MDPQARLCGLHSRQHGVAFVLELPDLRLHVEDRALGVGRIFLGSIQVGPHIGQVLGQLILFLDKHDREIVLVRVDRGIQLRLGLREVPGRLPHSGIEILTSADDRGGRRLQLGVLLDHRVNRVFVRDLRVALLNVGNPQRDEPFPEVHQSNQYSTTGHGYFAFFMSDGLVSLGDSRTTRATASWPKNSSTR